MNCCLEAAILDKIRALDCNPIMSENHFLDERKCTDCMPYMVLKVKTTGGLRTSSDIQKLSIIEIAAYFKDSSRSQAAAFRDMLDNMLYVRGCIDLGICGCLCQQGVPSSQMIPGAGLIRYGVTFRGFYRPAETGSLSASV